MGRQPLTTVIGLTNKKVHITQYHRFTITRVSKYVTLYQSYITYLLIQINFGNLNFKCIIKIRNKTVIR
jgi:hypothetical protein